MKNSTKKYLSKTLSLAITAGLLAGTFLYAKPVFAAEETVLSSTFENNTEGWINYGNCNLMTAGWTKNSGNQSLYVGNRPSNWSGALYSLQDKVKAGNTYKLSAYWMSWQIHYTEDMKLTFVYDDINGNKKYQCVQQNTAPSGQWTNIGGTITIPQGAKNPAIYFETTKNNYDYYLDDIVITQLTNNNPGTNDPAQNPDQNPSQNPDTNPGQNPDTNPGQNPDSNPGQNPSTNPGADQTPDAYMNKIKISADCPSANSTRRNNVSYGSFVHKTYYSNTTHSNRGFNILLPANYNPQKKYPVLYVLHGIFGNEGSLLSNGIPEIVANQAADGKAKEMIVVLPNIYADPNGGSPALNDAGVFGYDNFVNDLANDLMPYIEKNYSVSTAREDQAIAGFSMGGREALYIGLTRSDLFGYVMGISPAPGLTPGRDYAMNHKGMLQESELKVAKTDTPPYAIMLCCGTNDSVVGKFPESYHNILTRNNQNHIWYTVPGADHDNRAIQSGINNFTAAIFHADGK